MEIIGGIIFLAIAIFWAKGQMDLAQKKANKILSPKQPKNKAPQNKTNTSPTYAKQDEDDNYLFEISGSHHYQENLKKVVMAIAKEQGDTYDPEESVCYEEISTSLTLEPENPHDPNAVKVVIKGKHVGYLPKEYVARFDNKTNKRCKAEIQGEEDSYEVVLNLDT